MRILSVVVLFGLTSLVSVAAFASNPTLPVNRAEMTKERLLKFECRFGGAKKGHSCIATGLIALEKRTGPGFPEYPAIFTKLKCGDDNSQEREADAIWLGDELFVQTYSSDDAAILEIKEVTRHDPEGRWAAELSFSDADARRPLHLDNGACELEFVEPNTTLQ